MNIAIHQATITEFAADAVIVNLFEGVTRPGQATGAVDKALGGRISDLIALGDCTGKLGETVLLHTHAALPAPRVIVAGLGPAAEFDLAKARIAGAHAIRAAANAGARTVGTIVHGAGVGGLDAAEAAAALVEASLLEMYQMPRQASVAREKKEIAQLTVVELHPGQLPALQRGVAKGRILAESVNQARDLAAYPANVATPTMIAQTAQQMAAETGLRCQILEQAEMEALGMGILLAVAKGSEQPPKFLILEHHADRAATLPSIVLVGKGVTFDTGGYSLKTASPGTMWQMKDDMTGAAVVMATLRAAALLALPLHVVGLAPLTENLINGQAQKPGDVFRGMSGKTMEVISTDAEGRMVLADALAYAARFQPDAVIDVATLTGSIGIALGPKAAGLFTEDAGLSQRLLAAAAVTGERVWPMPMYADYAEDIKSEFADVKNSTSPDVSVGVSTSAKFLQHFTEGYPWAHLDIASVAWAKKARPLYPAGATAFGVRLLVQLLADWS